MQNNPIKLVVAVGNPGKEYEKTRHNIAWQLIEYLPFLSDMVWYKKFNGEYASCVLNNEKRYFLMPQTYMNRSGESVIQLMNFFKLNSEDVIVIHDELELPFGTYGLKENGGLAGHNGLRSISSVLGTREFLRLRLGISRPEKGGNVTNYVLGQFSKEEQERLPEYLEEAANALDTIISENGSEKVLKAFKRKTAIS